MRTHTHTYLQTEKRIFVHLFCACATTLYCKNFVCTFVADFVWLQVTATAKRGAKVLPFVRSLSVSNWRGVAGFLQTFAL